LQQSNSSVKYTYAGGPMTFIELKDSRSAQREDDAIEIILHPAAQSAAGYAPAVRSEP